jgi:Flp pilus assembly protein TadG
MSNSDLNRSRRVAKDRRGASLVAMVFLICVIITMVAFTMEVGRMYLLRSQMLKAVDAGTIAATLELVSDPDDIETAKAAAEQYVQLNRVGMGITVPEDAITVEVGQWDSETKAFTVTNTEPNAVRVSGNQENEPFFFGRIMGQQTFKAPASAVASGSSGPLDIMMVLDLSGSMSSNGRIQALQSAAPEFVSVIEQFGDEDKVGVMGYGVRLTSFQQNNHGNGTPYSLSPANEFPANNNWVAVLENDLTDSFTSLKSNILTSSVLVSSKYGGGTPIGAAIRDGAHYVKNSSFGRDDARDVVVLMSDGEANKPGGSYPLQMAAYAKSLKVRVYTISLGSSADTNLMQSIADATGGQHFDATGSSGGSLTSLLTDAFKNAAAALKRPQLVK